VFYGGKKETSLLVRHRNSVCGGVATRPPPEGGYASLQAEVFGSPALTKTLKRTKAGDGAPSPAFVRFMKLDWDS